MRAIIRYMQEKLKSWISNDQVFYGLLLILVGCSSFALGRLSLADEPLKQASGVSFSTSKALPEAESPLISTIANPVDTDRTLNESTETAQAVVASKSGTKYHLPECPGAKQIKPDNIVTFSSRAEAEQAGYTPAANCLGLQ